MNRLTTKLSLIGRLSRLSASARLRRSYCTTERDLQTETLGEPLARAVGQPSWITHPHLLKEGELIPGMHQGEFLFRRRRLFELFVESCHEKGLADGADSYLMLLPAATTSYSAPDVPYEFRQDSNFMYLTGYQEPDCLLAIYGHKKRSGDNSIDPVSVLMVGRRTVHKELWEGPQSGPDGALLLTGVDMAVDRSNATTFFESEFPAKNKTVVGIVSPPKNEAICELIVTLLKQMNVIKFPSSIASLVHELRWLKSASEAALLAKVASIGCASLQQTMQFTSAGMVERVLTAKYNQEAVLLGADRLAYPPVVAGGHRANIIHYLKADQVLNSGDLVLMDVGCDSFGYVCDMTRTWPVDSKNCSDAQLVAWQALVEVHKELLHMVDNTRPLTLDMVYGKMLKLLCIALKRIKAVDQSVEGSDLEQLARDVCPHHVSHYLGMDVHDCATISRDRHLHSGAYITVEPGLYFQVEDTALRKEFRGIGMRVEDDVMITENGATNLTQSCPYYR